MTILKSPTGMLLTFERVTPKDAAAFLENNRANRRLRDDAVAAYAQDMTAGFWEIIPHAICFGAEGQTLNGQHTLSAIVKCGIPQWLLIARNVTAETAAVMDSGRVRSMADQMRMVGEVDIDTPSLKLARYVTSGLEAFGRRGLMSFNAALTEYARHKTAIDFVRRATKTVGRRKGWSTAFLTVVTRAWYTADHSALERFLQIIEDGMTADPLDLGAIRLRDYMGSRSHSGMSMQRELYGKTQCGLKAFLIRLPVSRLTITPAELFPVPDIDTV